MKGRTENSVKNRYLSLLNLHSFSRKKEKLSPYELRAKIEQKLTELKAQNIEQQTCDRFLALRSEAFIKALGLFDKKKQQGRKKIKDINYHQNFTHLMNQIKNNEELCKNVQNIFRNLWASIHQKMKVLDITDFETRYLALLKSSEKVPFQPKYNSNFNIFFYI